jgi:hypothetical protein
VRLGTVDDEGKQALSTVLEVEFGVALSALITRGSKGSGTDPRADEEDEEAKVNDLAVGGVCGVPRPSKPVLALLFAAALPGMFHVEGAMMRGRGEMERGREMTDSISRSRVDTALFWLALGIGILDDLCCVFIVSIH